MFIPACQKVKITENRERFVANTKRASRFIISAQPFDGINLSSSSMIGGWEGKTPTLLIFPLWALAY